MPTQQEFAPGIPLSRAIQPIPAVREPISWQFGIHAHHAEKAGEHFDLRLGDPETGHAHSWALKYLPKPGDKRLVVQQPTHTLKYMDFKGRIESGYGKGDVDLARRDKTEIVSASNGHVRFNIYGGKETEEYLLRRQAPDSKNWIIHNLTATRQVGPGQHVPSSKPSYGVIKPEKIDVENPNTELQAKIDGAHVLYQFKDTGRTAKIFSYRPTERATGIIEHTHRLPDYWKNRTPSALKDSVLRGELYAEDKKGIALPAARVGGILNSNVWKSREKQKEEGKLVPVVFDVVRWKGKNVEDEPYAAKKQLLAQAVKAAPWLRLPRTATTPAEKKKLISDIHAGREPSTVEGVIEWHKDKPVPKKSKFLQERDVYVRNIFAEAGEKRKGTMAGGFEFSTAPKGPIIGRVGTGMSHAMKKDLLDNPSKYIGLKTRIMAQRAPENYAPRAPVFHSFHLDQDLPEGIKTADTVKKTVEFQGLKVKIDRPKGFVQSGKDEQGKPWTRTYKYDYGFLPKTEGGDGEGLDVFIGPDKDDKETYWAIQKKSDGSFDEYKVFFGFGSKAAAKKAFIDHIPAKFLGSMTTISINMVKAMLNIEPAEKIAALLSYLQRVESVQGAWA